ncbi:MAG: hypothetical protein AABX51_08940 [Nanoarchaeota archaeon]
MECTRHQKSFVGMCQLCGNNLCKLCVAKVKGARIWCDGCSRKLDSFPELKVHQPREELIQSPHQSDAEWYEISKPVKLSERSFTQKFGYFDFASLAKTK